MSRETNREALDFFTEFGDACRVHDPDCKLVFAICPDGTTLGRDKYGPFPSPPERGQTA